MATDRPNYRLGEKGVNLVASPLHTPEGGLLSAQNVEFIRDQGIGGIGSRGGLAPLNTTALAGAVMAVANIPLALPTVGIMLLACDTGETETFKSTPDGTVWTDILAATMVRIASIAKFPDTITPVEITPGQRIVTLGGKVYYPDNDYIITDVVSPFSGNTPARLNVFDKNTIGGTPSDGYRAYSFYQLTGIPTDGRTITIFGLLATYVYTWRAAPTGPFDVQIGASADASIDNLIGVVFPANPEVVAFKQSTAVVRISATNVGTYGNAIGTATDEPLGAWGNESWVPPTHLALGEDPGFTYNGPVLAIPNNPLAVGPARWISDLWVNNGLIYMGVFDLGGVAPDLNGRVLAFNPDTRTVDQVGKLPFGDGTGEMQQGFPFCLTSYLGQLWAGTYGITAAGTLGNLYRILPGVDENWTLDKTALAASGYYMSLCEYNGNLYAASSSTAAGNSARVEQRTAAAVWSTSFTAPDTGISYCCGLIVFEGELYAAYFKNTVRVLIKKFDGTSWTTDKDVGVDYGNLSAAPGAPFIYGEDLYWPFTALTAAGTTGFLLKRTPSGVWSQVLTGLSIRGALTEGSS